MIICSEHSLVKDTATRREATPLYCRSWHCEWCRPRRKAQLIRLAQEGDPNTFITLTVNPAEGDDPVARFEALTDAWRTVVRRAKRAHGSNGVTLHTRNGKPVLDYIAIAEKTEAGEPHLHILCRARWIDQRWLSDQMNDLINAPIVDIRRIRHVGQVTRYVSKYVGKAPHRFGKKKRYWATRWYARQKDKSPVMDRGQKATWHRASLSLDDIAALWRYTFAKVFYDGSKLVALRQLE